MRPKTSEVLRRVLTRYQSGEVDGICLVFEREIAGYIRLYYNLGFLINRRLMVKRRTDLIWPQNEKYRYHRIRFVNLLIHHFESIGD